MTFPTTRHAGLLFAGALLATASPAALAAESYGNCTGFIDSLPATISSQGTWCLRHDVSTAMASGAAVTIATNNVTLDCNDFKIGGLAAGSGTQARGIVAEDRSNATIRNCNVRGFRIGAFLTGAGHAVEDSRFEKNTFNGIHVQGDGLRVRNNRILDTGGQAHYAEGLRVYQPSSSIEIRDNFISNVSAVGDNTVRGISAMGSSGVISRNTIVSLQSSWAAFGIAVQGANQVLVSDNVAVTGAPGPIPGSGVSCDYGHARGNIVGGFNNLTANCVDGGGNLEY